MSAPLDKIHVEIGTDPAITWDFWDCECEGRYIHPKTHLVCPVCSALEADMPDSRLDEIGTDNLFLTRGDMVLVSGEWHTVLGTIDAEGRFPVYVYEIDQQVLLHVSDVVGVQSMVRHYRYVDIVRPEQD